MDEEQQPKSSTSSSIRDKELERVKGELEKMNTSELIPKSSLPPPSPSQEPIPSSPSQEPIPPSPSEEPVSPDTLKLNQSPQMFYEKWYPNGNYSGSNTKGNIIN